MTQSMLHKALISKYYMYQNISLLHFPLAIKNIVLNSLEFNPISDMFLNST